MGQKFRVKREILKGSEGPFLVPSEPIFEIFSNCKEKIWALEIKRKWNEQIAFFNEKNFSCREKIFQNGSLGSKNGPSDPLKFLVSLEISKLGPLAHFYSLMNHFEIFLTASKNFLIANREK